MKEKRTKEDYYFESKRLRAETIEIADSFVFAR